jgi:aryl-alcohol dehydrogenase-like predicted oxidoreductase
MQTRKIGTLEVSVVGIGCNNFGWNIDEAATKNVVSAALDAGVNFFDTADVYGGTKSEEFLGRALGARRGEVILASKFGIKIDDAHPGGASPAYIRQAVENSLRRLGTDYLDLYQLHRPDPETPIAETLGALNELVTAGKVREIGCSNFSAAQLQEAEAATAPGAARFVSVQNEYSLLHREPEAEVLPACEHLGLAFLPYFPLASGLLTGKYRQGQPVPEGSRLSGERFQDQLTEEKLAVVEALIAFSVARSHMLLDLAFSWLLTRPTVASVIAGATTEAQIQSNAAAANWQLTEGDLAEVDRLLSGV